MRGRFRGLALRIGPPDAEIDPSRWHPVARIAADRAFRSGTAVRVVPGDVILRRMRLANRAFDAA